MINLMKFFQKETLNNQAFRNAMNAGQKDFSKLRLIVDFRGIDVSGLNFFKSDLRQCTNLRLAKNIPEANWQRTNLIGLDLSDTDLRKIVLRHCKLKWINFSDSDLGGANMSWSSLSGANLSWTNLSGVNLSFSNLRGANFSRADFQGANLIWSNKQLANMTRCRLWKNTQVQTRK